MLMTLSMRRLHSFLVHMFIAILTLFLHYSVGEERCKIKRSQRGFALENSSYYSSITADYPTCLFHCLNNKYYCRSLTYNLETKTCALSNETRWSKPLQYKGKSNNIYMEMIGVAEIVTRSTIQHSIQRTTNEIPISQVIGTSEISTLPVSQTSHITASSTTQQLMPRQITSTAISHKPTTQQISSTTQATDMSGSLETTTTLLIYQQPTTQVSSVQEMVTESPIYQQTAIQTAIYQETTTRLPQTIVGNIPVTTTELPISQHTILAQTTSSIQKMTTEMMTSSAQETTIELPTSTQTILAQTTSSIQETTTELMTSSAQETTTELPTSTQTILAQTTSSIQETTTELMTSSAQETTTELPTDHESPTPAAQFDSSTFCIGKTVVDHAHPTDCTKYVTCVHGITYIRDCGPAVVPGICGLC